jgi:hypothetical protein
LRWPGAEKQISPLRRASVEMTRCWKVMCRRPDCSGRRFGEDGLEGGVFEETDLDADGDDLAEVGGGGEVFAAGAEMGEAEVSGAGEFEAGGDDGGVEVDNGAELDLNAELHGGGGEGLAVEDPAAAVCEGGGKGGK